MEGRVFSPTGSATVWDDIRWPGRKHRIDLYHLCSWLDATGRYRVGALRIEFFDEYYSRVSVARTRPARFHVRKARSRTTVPRATTRIRRNRRVRLRAVSRYEALRRWPRASYSTIRFEVRHRGKWRRLGRAYANVRGVATKTIRWKYPRRARIRAITMRKPNYRGSRSRAVILRRAR